MITLTKDDAIGMKRELDSDSVSDKDEVHITNEESQESTNTTASPLTGTSDSNDKDKVKKEAKECVVCGDVALGCNFGAVTCESCKAFFRRNAAKCETLTCIFESKCKIDKNTRRFCTFCRMKKCLAASMKKEYILGDNEKRLRQERVREVSGRKSRKRHQRYFETPEEVHQYPSVHNDYPGYSYPQITPGSHVPYPPHMHYPPPYPNQAYPPYPLGPPSYHQPPQQHVITQQPVEQYSDSSLLHQNSPKQFTNNSVFHTDKAPVCVTQQPTAPTLSIDNKLVNSVMPQDNLLLDFADDLNFFLESTTTSNFNGSNGNCASANEILVSNTSSTSADLVKESEGSWMEEIGYTLPRIHLDENEEMPVQSDGKTKISLNDDLSRLGQARMLSETQWSTINDLRQAYEGSFLSSALESTAPAANASLNNLVNTSGFIVKKLINFAKKLADFSMLSQGCQIALLKGVVMHTIMLLSATHYNVEKDIWVTPHGDIPTKILMFVTGFNGFYEEHAKYCRAFRLVVDQDAHITALMHVLSLFSADRQTVLDKQQVSNIHDRYVLLLKHYLEARYGFREARRMLSGILANLVQLNAFTESQGKILLHVDPNQVDPLMLEIFNLHDLNKSSKCVAETASTASPASSITLPSPSSSSASMSSPPSVSGPFRSSYSTHNAHL